MHGDQDPPDTKRERERKEQEALRERLERYRSDVARVLALNGYDNSLEGTQPDTPVIVEDK